MRHIIDFWLRYLVNQMSKMNEAVGDKNQLQKL